MSRAVLQTRPQIEIGHQLTRDKCENWSNKNKEYNFSKTAPSSPAEVHYTLHVKMFYSLDFTQLKTKDKQETRVSSLNQNFLMSSNWNYYDGVHP